MGDSNGRRCSTIHGRQRAEVGSTQRYEEEIRDRSAVLGAKSRPNLLCAIPEKATYARGSPNEAVARGNWSSCNSFTASQESWIGRKAGLAASQWWKPVSSREGSGANETGRRRRYVQKRMMNKELEVMPKAVERAGWACQLWPRSQRQLMQRRAPPGVVVLWQLCSTRWCRT
jgi:hypothetical protein